MTNQEAIDIITKGRHDAKIINEALELAVTALEKQEQAAVQSDRDAVFRRCISTYGADAQIDMAIEEMSELTKALLKNRRDSHSLNAYQNIVDEMADVKIMLRQMEIIFDCERDVERRIDFKVERQIRRLEEFGGDPD